jgi:hypothetical protein
MNSLRSLNFIVFFLPLVLLAHGDRAEFSISGVVNNASTDQPVSGALISVENNGQIIYSTRTSEGGAFEIRFSGPVGRHDQLRIRISKKGYHEHSFQPLNFSAQEVNNIELSPQSPMHILKPVNSSTPLIAI